MFNKYARGSKFRSYPCFVQCCSCSRFYVSGQDSACSSYLDIFENSIEGPLPLLFGSHGSRLVHLSFLPLLLLHHVILEGDAPPHLLLHPLVLALLLSLRLAWLLWLWLLL